jgi:pilus assembly protein CpaC
VDWAATAGSNGFAVQTVSGLIRHEGGNIRDIVTSGGETFAFGIVDGNDQFSGILEALQQNNVAKILAEPNIVAISGRPAQFNSGGEVPVLIPQSLGTTTIEFKKFGTQVDFLPIVIGDGRIRLEVRPRVSAIDPSLGILLDDIVVPGFKSREVDTAVEMRAGQTFALAGLIEERTEALSRGLPYLSDVPVLGWPFRRTEEEVNEIEILILVTPEFVDPMDPHEVPCGGPGLATTQPDNCDLYCGGHLEVPTERNPIRGPHACGNNCGCDNGSGHGSCNCHGHGGPNQAVITDGLSMPGGVGYDDSYGGAGNDPVTISDESNSGRPSPTPRTMPQQPAGPMPTMPDDLPLPTDNGSPDTGASFGPAGPAFAGRPYSPNRQPTFQRERSNPNNPFSAPLGQPASVVDGPSDAGLIGPVGYDAE